VHEINHVLKFGSGFEALGMIVRKALSFKRRPKEGAMFSKTFKANSKNKMVMKNHI